MNKDYMKDPYPRPGYTINGMYRGVVEDDNDPVLLGRVRVRIPTMHGIRTSDPRDYNVEYLPTWGLPWAPVLSVGAGYDQGSFITPEVGTTVGVIFEDGNPEKPVVVGGLYGAGTPVFKDLGNIDDRLDDEEYEPSTYRKSNGVYNQPVGIRETPSDSYDDPKNKVVYKSPKGATISIVEVDGMESINIIDHAGQIFRMLSPFTEDANNYNSARRGMNRADRGVGNINEVSDQPHIIEMVGTNGGFLRLISNLDGTTKLQIHADEIETTSELTVVRGKTVSEMKASNEELTRKVDEESGI